MSPLPRSIVSVVGVAFAALAAAQQAQPPQQPTVPPVFGSYPQPAPQEPARPRPPGLDPLPIDRMEPSWNRLLQTPAAFQGFPVFPSRLTGYGAYPSSPGAALLPLVTPPFGEPAEQVADWPSWLRVRGRAPLPYRPDTALLVRHSDRVWWRATPEDAFVPLYFHSKISAIAAGAEVRVHQTGEFELLLHDSGRVMAQGPTQLRVAELGATEVKLEVPELTRLRVFGYRRVHSLRLPDGSTLSLPPEVPDGEIGGPTQVLLERVDEPAWFGGRAFLFNAGPRDVTLVNALGTTKIPAGHRVTLFLQPSAIPLPAGVDAGQAAASRAGPVLQVDATIAGDVSWCGARFHLPAGGAMRFDPIQGSPFDPPMEPTQDTSPAGPKKTP